jgi:hypothetical protein
LRERKKDEKRRPKPDTNPRLVRGANAPKHYRRWDQEQNEIRNCIKYHAALITGLRF